MKIFNILPVFLSLSLISISSLEAITFNNVTEKTAVRVERVSVYSNESGEDKVIASFPLKGMTDNVSFKALFDDIQHDIGSSDKVVIVSFEGTGTDYVDHFLHHWICRPKLKFTKDTKGLNPDKATVSFYNYTICEVKMD